MICKYRKAISLQRLEELRKPFLVCNTIDTENRMNMRYVVSGIRYSHLIKKLKKGEYKNK